MVSFFICFVDGVFEGGFFEGCFEFVVDGILDVEVWWFGVE